MQKTIFLVFTVIAAGVLLEGCGKGKAKEAAASTESQNQYEQTQAAFQTLTGATVPEDRTKAQADVQTAQQTLDVAKKLYENRVGLQKQGALAQKLVDEANVAMVQAQSQL